MATDRDELEAAKATIARLTTERDQALARASAAAMEMRERAAEELDQWWKDDLPEDYPVPLIRALPIDPDAKKALDWMLAKAREDAIREAAELAAAGHHPRAILALLNDGGQP